MNDYKEWLKSLDKIFDLNFNLHHDDFEDWMWRDDFERGISPLEAFLEWRDEQG